MRAEGYYWVKLSNNDYFEIAEWDGETWGFIGHPYVVANPNFSEIDERPIVRPEPRVPYTKPYIHEVGDRLEDWCTLNRVYWAFKDYTEGKISGQELYDMVFPIVARGQIDGYFNDDPLTIDNYEDLIVSLATMAKEKNNIS